MQINNYRRSLPLVLLVGAVSSSLGLGCGGPSDVSGVKPSPVDGASVEDAPFGVKFDVEPPKLDGGFLPPPVDSPVCVSCGIDVPALAYCGDGIWQPGEGCDDGDGRPGDGCSGICVVEPGYVCPTPGAPCVPIVVQVCGNGLIEGSEACDDGNTAALDGCSAGCAVEAGWECKIPGQPCTPTVVPSKCGDSVVQAGEGCDDGNTITIDGCDAKCQLEQGWTCPNPGKPCTRIEYCGDGALQPARGEACDDGNPTPGDGCTGACTVEAGYVCPTPGKPCQKIWVCGNGMIDPGESCDDGNTVSGDGCLLDCSTVEPGWTCPRGANNTGGPCTKVPANVCGNGILGTGEGCDDGNTASLDGCSSACAPEAGWDCPTVGKACQRVRYCGDSIVSLDLAEQCDDGNTAGADGCSPQCTVEGPDWVCPVPGKPCESTVECGDSKITGKEECDDGNTAAADGCSVACKLEPGWTCPVVGAACSAKACGDGTLAGTEQCDDGNTASSDGCSAACRLESGWACGPNEWHLTAPTTQCYRTVCGDGQPEGTEQCDKGDNVPFDGCSPDCKNEPKCGYDTSQAYKCFSVCGDGIKMPDEACDDGNLQNGDGCSSTCKVEPGFECTASAPALGESITVPILYRDFNWHHPQFEVTPVPATGQRLPGIAASTIGSDGKPVYNPAFVGGTASPARPSTMDGPAMDGENTTTLMTDAAGATYRSKTASNAASLNATEIAKRYADWYTNDPAATGTMAANVANPAVTRVTIQSTLTLDRISAGTYQYYSSAFYPLDGLGYGNIQPYGHNFLFTSEAHYWFQYSGGEKLEFRGDDDVWVFVNGKLAVDLGGIHGELRGIVTLNGASTQVCVDDTSPACAGQPVCDDPPPPNCTPVSEGFGLVAGNVYEIIVFQAERHVIASNYKLTLSGFNAPISTCRSICGDGIVTRGEACDLGTAKNTGAYGTCNEDCTLPPRCGDTKVQNPPEQCDDGINLATYGGTAKVCGASCLWAPYCGDGAVTNGEECDEGASNGAGYGHCTDKCRLGPRCGDSMINGGEECDDGKNNGTSGSDCTSTCTLKCGNGVWDPGEQCDNGRARNTGGYGSCNADCTPGPNCGDGIKNGPEQCDDGKNDGTYGTCAPGCLFAAYCGDGQVNGGAEVCDLGAGNSASAYGRATCTDRCGPGPYCGDKQVQGQFGEVCDDGVNSGLPGSCTPDCTGFVPLLSCGDGMVVPPELCDQGALNGSLQSVCDAHCRFKCGNGIKDPGEQCDDGVNSGKYGTCNANCTLAAYCGDGLKSANEQCDFGTANVSPNTAYGPGLCTTLCTWAPYCGDGRVQSLYAEECDGGDGCDVYCKSTGPIPVP